MRVNQRMEESLDTLEALYFLTQGLDSKGGRDVADIRAHYRELSESVRRKMLGHVRSDIELLRKHYGALAPNDYYKRLRTELGEGNDASAYIGKLRIDSSLFGQYNNALSRRPHVKQHAFVVFHQQKECLTNCSRWTVSYSMMPQFMIQKARNLLGNESSQLKLSASRHRVLHSVFRAIITALFTFVEAYLNGIAFDCFHSHHDTLDLADHDLLAEWDSAKGRTRFVPFDKKVFRYPVIVAMAEGRTIDLAGFRQAHRIVQSGKDVRDAITHPSAHFDPGIHEQRKIGLLAGLTLPAVEALYQDIHEYVNHVETEIGHNASLSVPWLFDELGFAYGNSEAI